MVRYSHHPFQERAMRFYTETHQHYCGIDGFYPVFTDG